MATDLPQLAAGPESVVSPSGTEAPTLGVDAPEPTPIHRTFAFADLCGFTRHLERKGATAAIDLLTEFRAVTREVAGRRGVRIAKWLGDGVMCVAVDGGPLAATAVELTARFEDRDLRLRAGLASGSCLLFEADDYIGGPINLAARLTDVARPGEVLADENTASLAPDWVDVSRARSPRLHGFGRVRGIRSLALSRDLVAAA